MTWASYSTVAAVVNVCIQVLLCCAIGFVSAVSGLVKPPERAALQSFVFNIALPLHVARGVALQVNFFDEAMWRVVGAFLVLRALTLVAAALITAALTSYSKTPAEPCLRHDRRPRSSAAARTAEVWLGLCWVSTIILGVPTLSATFGDEGFAFRLGLQASMSSFIFQLPGILLLLETHYVALPSSSPALVAPPIILPTDPVTTPISASQNETAAVVQHRQIASTSSGSSRPSSLPIKVALHTMKNPVLIGILVGVSA